MARRTAPVPPRAAAPAVRPAPPSPAVAARELRTLRDLLRYASTRFEHAGLAYGQGTDNARDEAAWLLLWSLRLPPDALDPWLDAQLTAAERRFALSLLERRCVERLPAAYLTGEAWLRGHRFRCDARALVPRSLIAEALEEAIDDWLPPEGPATVLDLCTGGGSLAIVAAHRFPGASLDATDLSADALALARENVEAYGLRERIRLVRGDLFGAVPGRRYDLVLCNPPYVNAASMAALPAEFRAEPRGALAGGADGMDLVRRVLHDAPAHLTGAGVLLLEIGHEARFFEAAFPRLEFAYLPVTAGDDQLVLVTREQLARAR